MTKPPEDPRPEPRLFRTLRDDVGHVLDDVRKRGIRRAFGVALSDLERFYLSESTRRRLSRMPAIPRAAQRFWLLIHSLLMKLTPARRVLLAGALLLLLFGNQRLDFGDVHIIFNFRVVSIALFILLLMLELKDKLLARDELQAGRAVQLALMPQRHPIVPGWDVWMYTEPANDVGGDLVDHLAIDDSRHGVALGDVAGKALPAALLMVKLQATLRALIPQFGSLSDLGAGVNRILVRDGLPSRFATLIYLVLTADSGSVRVLNAGHPPPLIVRGAAIDELPRGSMALGILANAVFVEQSVDLGRGDVLIVYSDGVTEAANASDEFFGDERLKDAARHTAGSPAAVIGAEIVRALAEFVGDAPPHDDVSLVVVRRGA
jgi:serine phosphatase RsbU (regulator of sigma subunit)